jgi:hypothetical protein
MVFKHFQTLVNNQRKTDLFLPNGCRKIGLRLGTQILLGSFCCQPIPFQSNEYTHFYYFHFSCKNNYKDSLCLLYTIWQTLSIALKMVASKLEALVILVKVITAL